MQKDYEGLKNKDIYTILDGIPRLPNMKEKNTVCRTIRRVA